MEFSVKKLGGGRGLGLDIDPRKVEASRMAGYEAQVADVSQLDARHFGTTRFVVMTHFLEHLPSVGVAGRCIRSAVSAADEFVFVRQPYFDADAYLASLGLRLYWSHWRGHRNHMRAADFQTILTDLLARRKIRRYVLFARTRVTDSFDSALHPISSPMDQHEWRAEKHASKPFFEFPVPVYREIGAIIHTRNRNLSEAPRRFLLSCDLIYDSQNKLDTTENRSF